MDSSLTAKNIIYRVTDRQIEELNKKISQTIDLANVKTLDVEQNWFDKKFGIGDVKLSTETRSITLLGQPKPENLSDMLSSAINAERNRIDDLNIISEKPADKPPSPGTLDKLDYLTGLWQQGLLSNEDYQKEKKHFES